MAYYVFNEKEIPFGMHVCHECDNRRCVNPQHLFLGTNRDNVADKLAKGRQHKGQDCGRAKLTNADVLAIRADATSTHVDLAKTYGVGATTIRKIRDRTSWTHL